MNEVTLRLIDLNKRILHKKATQKEKDEYVKILLDNKVITEDCYNDYLINNKSESLMRIILLVGSSYVLTCVLYD